MPISEFRYDKIKTNKQEIINFIKVSECPAFDTTIIPSTVI